MPGDTSVGLRKNDDPFGWNTRTVGVFSVESKDRLNGSHCDTEPSNAHDSTVLVVVFLPANKHPELSDGWILITSDTFPVPCPFASSREATNSMPAANGRKVMAAPVLV
jgi:hypothetical protein